MHTLAGLIMGSKLYGTSDATSDIDEFWIYIETLEETLKGIAQSSRETIGERDITRYSLRRWAHGIEDGNIGFLAMLYVPATSIISEDPLWAKLQAYREDFISRSLLEKAKRVATHLARGSTKERSHGVRVAMMAVELASIGHIELPPAIIPTLQQVRRGEINEEQTIRLVDALLLQVVAKADLPDYCPRVWEVVKMIYQEFWKR
jgi:hypothetical protein